MTIDIPVVARQDETVYARNCAVVHLHLHLLSTRLSHEFAHVTAHKTMHKSIPMRVYHTCTYKFVCTGRIEATAVARRQDEDPILWNSRFDQQADAPLLPQRCVSHLHVHTYPCTSVCANERVDHDASACIRAKKALRNRCLYICIYTCSRTFTCPRYWYI
jgi:hypothetical protein